MGGYRWSFTLYRGGGTPQSTQDKRYLLALPNASQSLSQVFRGLLVVTKCSHGGATAGPGLQYDVNYIYKHENVYVRTSNIPTPEINRILGT